MHYLYFRIFHCFGEKEDMIPESSCCFLCIFIGGSLKLAVKKVNSTLGIIGKGTENKPANVVMPLDKSAVWLHLDSCVNFWSSHLKGDIVVLERMQKSESK